MHTHSQNENLAEGIKSALEHAQAGDYGSARAILEKLVAIDAGHYEANLLLGVACYHLKDYKSAESRLGRAHSINPGNPVSHVYLADLYRALGDRDKAVSHYTSSLGLLTDKRQIGDIYFKLAVLYQQQEQYSKSIESYEACLKIQPRNATAYYNSGIIYCNVKNYQRAEECFIAATKLSPEYYAAYNNLASILLEQGRYDQAAAYYRRALSIRPESVDIMLNMAAVYYQQEKMEEAAKVYSEIAEKNPQLFIVWERLGAVYKHLKRSDKSIECYKRAHSIDPDHAEVRYQLAATGNYDASEMPAAPPEFVARLFDDYADKFDNHLVEKLKYRTPERIHAAVAKTIQLTDNSLKIIDLGCGTGLCGKLFAGPARMLTGVDLSQKMVNKARERGCYDNLVVGDIAGPLLSADSEYDLILSSDVFVYIGDLEPIFTLAFKALAPGGHFAFSVEALTSGSGYKLHGDARYAHSGTYLRELTDRVGFEEVYSETCALREQEGVPVRGYIYIIRKNG